MKTHQWNIPRHYQSHQFIRICTFLNTIVIRPFYQFFFLQKFGPDILNRQFNKFRYKPWIFTRSAFFDSLPFIVIFVKISAQLHQ